MDGPDHPQDEQPGTTNNVPALIHDYRAQREAWREQARNLARMREEVLAAADREARDIVSAARADVRRILLKARRDLLVLAAQVRAAGRLGDSEETVETISFLPSDDLGHARDALSSARHDVRRVLDESRPELEGLASEGEALRAALRQQKRPTHPLAQPPRATLSDRFAPPPVDLEFGTIAIDEPEAAAIGITRVQRPVRVFVAAAAGLAFVVVVGTAWWLMHGGEPEAASASAPAAATQKPAAAAPGGARAATSSTAAPVRSTSGPAAVSLNVTAKRLAWVRLTADGRVTAERLFKAGETQHVSAAREVSVRAGDAGAVFVSVDGRQAVALGDEGEVVTRRFTAPAPAPTKPAAVTPKAPVAPSAPNASVPVARSPVQRPSVASAAPSALSNPPVSAPRTPEPQTFTPSTAQALPSPAIPAPAATAGARPTTPPTVERPAAPTTTAPPPAASVAAPAARVSVEDSIANASSQWLDAYYRQDRARMTAISGTQSNVSDDRNDKEKLPRGLAGVRRSLDDVQVKVIGAEAMLTARMTERMEDTASGKMAQAVSYVSHMWSQRNGVWQLHDVRIVSASALSRSLR